MVQKPSMEEEFLEGAKRNNERVALQEIKDRESLGKEGVKFHEVEKDEFRVLTKKVFENNKNLTPGVYDTIQAELAKIRGK